MGCTHGMKCLIGMMKGTRKKEVENTFSASALPLSGEGNAPACRGVPQAEGGTLVSICVVIVVWIWIGDRNPHVESVLSKE